MNLLLWQNAGGLSFTIILLYDRI